jgi:hypothetical protein
VSGYLERLGKPLPEDGKNFGEAKKLYFSAATELFWRYTVNIITVLQIKRAAADDHTQTATPPWLLNLASIFVAVRGRCHGIPNDPRRRAIPAVPIALATLRNLSCC